MKNEQKREAVAKLRGAGLTFTEIGEALGVTRGRAHQIAKALKLADPRCGRCGNRARTMHHVDGRLLCPVCYVTLAG